jgi:hypothetical protein
LHRKSPISSKASPRCKNLTDRVENSPCSGAGVIDPAGGSSEFSEQGNPLKKDMSNAVHSSTPLDLIGL